MRFGKRAHAQRVLQFEITPMIDVVFLLIIFFMTTARLARDTKADLDLPREKGEQIELSEEAGIIINIDVAGRIIVSKNEISLDDLERIVLDAVNRTVGRDPENLKLTIRADRNGQSDRLNQVITRLQKLGVGAARVATEIPR